MSDEAPRWIGIDLGTQGVRAVVLRGDGRTAGRGVTPLTSDRRGGLHEQNPEDWWSATRGAVRAAVAEVDTAQVTALAVDGTSGTILLVDAEGRPLTPGLMYDDLRAVGEAAAVNRVGAKQWAAMGYGRMQPAWALPKLVWLARNSAAWAQAGVRCIHQTDFVNERLVGRPVATDYSNALKTGSDPIAGGWPWPVLEALGIGRGRLPPLVKPGALLGRLDAAAAAELGLSAQVSVHAGMTDSCAAQIGAGIMQPGSWSSVLGTTLALKGVTTELVCDPGGVMYSHRGPDDLWLPGGASSSGAGLLNKMLPGADLDALTRAAAARGDTAAFTYPLCGRGERFPFVAPDAEAFFSAPPADDVDAFRAILLGSACVERLCFDYVDLLGAPTDGTISFTGGGARNPYWTQLRADMLGRNVLLPPDAEPATGMAYLAAAAQGNGLAEAAREMNGERTPEVTARVDRSAPLMVAYNGFLAALVERDWIERPLADHAMQRATR